MVVILEDKVSDWREKTPVQIGLMSDKNAIDKSFLFTLQKIKYVINYLL